MSIKDKSIIMVIYSILDYVVLFFYSVLVFDSIVSNSSIPCSIDIKSIITIIYKLLLIISILKIFYYYDDDSKKARRAIVLYIFIMIMDILGICNYWMVAIPIVAVYNIKFKKIASCYVVVGTVSLCTVILYAVSEVILNDYDVSTVAGKLFVMGFWGHNGAMTFLFFILMAIFYLFQNAKFELLIVIVSMIITLVLFEFTKSKTSTALLLTICILLIIKWLFNKLFGVLIWERVHNLFCKTLIFTPLYAIVLDVLGILYGGRYGYSKGPWTLMDRYVMSYSALNKLGVKMPFSSIKSDELLDVSFNFIFGLGGKDYPAQEYFDIEYVNIFINFGFVFLIPYLLMQFFALYRLYKLQEWRLLLFFSFMIWYGCFERSVLLFTVCGIFLLTMFCDTGHIGSVDNNEYT